MSREQLVSGNLRTFSGFVRLDCAMVESTEELGGVIGVVVVVVVGGHGGWVVRAPCGSFPGCDSPLQIDFWHVCGILGWDRGYGTLGQMQGVAGRTTRNVDRMVLGGD
jgi:hypothetical protein